MQTCPKCGRANDVTRKYCVRCGASLLKRDEDSTPEPVKAPKPEPIQQVSVETEEPYVGPSSEGPSHLMKSEKAEPTESPVLDRESGKAVVKDIL
ncbi:zinc ribbon domain-containing protein, partial [Candidatus Thorarchaeota archaeon]